MHDGEYGVAAGQACVFYADAADRARVLGGGWIERALSRSDRPDAMAGSAEQGRSLPHVGNEGR